jgi:photosystem II stability/assembly factor-like uncharacterized protein
MIRLARRAMLVPLAVLAAGATPLLAQEPTTGFPAPFLDGFRFRSVGPAVTGGRVQDIEVPPDDPSTFYVAAASGGLWKSVNKGTTWEAIFDDLEVATFGDIAIAPSQPRTIYAGTGEQNNRQSTSYGNGVYRSDDAGSTWRHLGLAETRHIGRVLVHPRDPETAWVAAQGNLWAPSDQRGIYKTTDGGRTWRRTLFVDTLTGGTDLVLDPNNPDVLVAATYQRMRRAWGFMGGGPGSGLYRSTDGGETWSPVASGIPAGDKGRIGLAIAASNPRILNATIEHATDGGVYRSTDGGETWQRVNERNERPMYYSHIFIDPTDENRLYKLATNLYMSEDGGRDLRRMPTSPTYDVGVHLDYHALWIDPRDSRHYLLGGDAGLYETWDRGETYIRMNNLPIGQFYDIGLDMREPYRIYGGMQDNHSWVGPSANRRWTGIIADDWQQIGFGDGMYQSPDPTSHRYVYVNSQNGAWTRVDAETGDILEIRPAAPEGESYRHDWASPSLLSRHYPNVVYLGGNRLFISRDRGYSWEATDDLTRSVNRDTLRLMGQSAGLPSCSAGFGGAAAPRTGPCILSRNDGESTFSEITTIAESPLDPAILWVGTDDGNIQVSRDGGRTWTEVSRNLTGDIRSQRPRERAATLLPGRPRDGTYVSRVVASGRDAAEAFIALDAHRDGDFRPWVFRTGDFGRTWTPIAEGLDTLGSVRALVQDPVNPAVLYVGTEHALYASPNGGDLWAKFMGSLPTTIYMDLEIHPREHDLVAATHGRSIWVLDDARPLAEFSPAIAASPLHLFAVRPATTRHYWKDTSYRGHAEWNGENPPDGAILSYWLGRPADGVAITVSNASGRIVRRLEGAVGRGLNRAVWDLRHAPVDAAEAEAERDPLLVRDVGPRGAFVSPGTYTVVIEADGDRVTGTVEVRGDPDMPVTLAQAQAREEFLVRAAEAQGRGQELERRLTERRNQLRQAGSRSEQERIEQTLSRVQAAVRALGGIANSFNGSAVRPGSMHPPTQTHRQTLERAVAALEAAETLLGS